MSLHFWAGLALGATACAPAAMIILHLLPTGLSPVRNAVSQYGITRYRQGYRILTVALGVAGLAAVVGWVFAGREPAAMAHQAIE